MLRTRAEVIKLREKPGGRKKKVPGGHACSGLLRRLGSKPFGRSLNSGVSLVCPGLLPHPSLGQVFMHEARKAS